MSQHGMPVPPSGPRLWLLRGLAMLLPVLIVFAVVESGLRLAGYGGSYPLFVASPEDARWLMPNPKVVERYFAAGLAPSLAIEPNYFLRDKPDGAIRLVVQGGSSAAGFPYESGAALSRLLGWRLAQSFPERRVEVVDTAMSAVSSYMLLDFADEIVALEPDAVLVYAGHNEFVGLLGAGSVVEGFGTPALTRLALALDGLRVYQLIRNLYVRARAAIGEPETIDATTLMAAIARTQEIPLGSARYQRGIEQWRQNLTALVERYTRAGIPVFVATVAGNLGDQPPFVSAPLPDAVAAELAPALAAVRAARFDAVTSAALARLEALAAEYASAELYFAAAGVREARGESAAALALYRLARDHDRLRFRAPTAINAVTTDVAAATGARLVDVEAAFEAASPQGIVGASLMLEHLHPNAEGYFLLADTFYRALAAAAVPAPFPVSLSTPGADDQHWLFQAERYFGLAAIAEIRADYPFVPVPVPPALPPVASAGDVLGRAWFDGEIGWLEMAEASRDMAAGDPLRRAIASQRIADARPFRRDLALRAAADWQAAGRPLDAARYRREP